MDGLGFMVTRPKYQEFLAGTNYPMQVQCLQNVYGIDESNFINSDCIATITRQSIGRMLIVTKWKQLVLVDVHVLSMDVFIHMEW